MTTAHKQRLYKKNTHGFSLVEVIITIAILWIVLGVIAPNAKRILDYNRMVADINQASAVFRFARTHAISTYETTKVCPTRDYSQCTLNWTQALMVFVDRNHNDIRDDDEPLLVASSAIAKQHKAKGPQSSVRFYHSGANASPASLILCPVNNDNTLARALVISLQGRARVSKDTNNDGIHERVMQQNIDCISI